jgi:nucleotide-binding universal stress UspA family protein
LDTYAVLNETIPASLRDYLEAKRSELGALVSRTSVECGPAAGQILEVSGSEEIDLVVMASHGRRGLDRWLLGGVTTKVLRASPKPVLVVAGENVREPRLNTILVAMDGSECSLRAFERARDLATALGAVLILYRAVRMSWSGKDPEPELKEVQDDLERLAATCAGLETRVRVYPTDSSPQIVERSEELGADLIVMGSHGRQGLQHLFMGSVAEHTVHHSRCPIMVCH